MMKDGADRVGKGPFHLIEDHALELQGRIFRFLMIMPALLLKGAAGEQGIEDNIAIDIHDIKVFRRITAGKGIPGGVGTGHGIEKGGQAALIDLPEHIMDRIFFRAHEHGMLQDMGNPGGILGDSLKGETEGLIRVGVFYGQGWRAEHLVLKEIDFGIDISNMLFSSQDKSMIGGTWDEICHMRPCWG